MFEGAAAVADPSLDSGEPDPLPPSQPTAAATSALSWTGTLSEAEAAVVAKALRAAVQAEVRVSGQSALQPPASGPVVQRVGPALKRPAGSHTGPVAGTGCKKPKAASTVTPGRVSKKAGVIRKRPASASK